MTEPVQPKKPSETKTDDAAYPDYTPIEFEVKGIAEEHATEIDHNHNQELTWREMSTWARDNKAQIPDELQGLLTADTPHHISWQKIARDSGSELHTSRDGERQYYTYGHLAGNTGTQPGTPPSSPAEPAGDGGSTAPGNEVKTCTLPTITEDDVNNPGVAVNDILISQASDVDHSETMGLAMVDTDPGNGKWQFSADGGASWKDVGEVSDHAALVLNPDDRVRFVPDGKNSSTASFDFRAWNPTPGDAGQKVDSQPNGGTSELSAERATAHITATDVNDAPVLGTLDGPNPEAEAPQQPDAPSAPVNHAPVLTPQTPEANHAPVLTPAPPPTSQS